MAQYSAESLPSSLNTILQAADIRIDGERDWDIKIYSPNIFRRVLAAGSLGLGESYMEGEWEVRRLDQFFERLLRIETKQPTTLGASILHFLLRRLMNYQSLRRAWKVAEVHYDLGNDFYAAMLDKRMTYSCGFWAHGAKTLEEAQEAKLDLICRKLFLKPGMTLLDVGCGWGSLLGFAAEHYGVKGFGVTVSKEQYAWAKERYANLPIEFSLQDYRSLHGKFDRIASIGMFEHVGSKNYKVYMNLVRRCLKPDGLFLLQTIAKNAQGMGTDSWIDKYIFPNGELPSLASFGKGIDGLLILEDLHNFGTDYARTLLAWHSNFEATWPRFKNAKGEKFYRMWRYYLLSCAGAFRARELQLWQCVLSKKGQNSGYYRPI